MSSTTTIAVADPQALVRLGLRHLIHSVEGFQVVAELGSEAELLTHLQSDKAAQLVILDYNHPSNNFSISTVRTLRQRFPQVKVLVISGDEDKNKIYTVIQEGVNSFLTKSCDEVEIVDAIRATARGDKFFCTRILDYILERTFSRPVPDCGPTPLTPREIDILRLVAKGLIAKEIGRELNLSTHTVYTHRKNILKKLNLNSASELALYAVNAGLITADG